MSAINVMLPNEKIILAGVLESLNQNMLKLNGVKSQAEGVLRAKKSLGDSIHWLTLVVNPITTNYPAGEYPAGS